jgi:hypothetical protein
MLEILGTRVNRTKVPGLVLGLAARLPNRRSSANNAAMKLLIIDDHAPLREGLAALLQLGPDITVLSAEQPERMAVFQARRSYLQLDDVQGR